MNRVMIPLLFLLEHMIPGDTGSIISSVGSSPTLVGEEIGVSERRSRRDLWPDDRRRSSTGNQSQLLMDFVP